MAMAIAMRLAEYGKIAREIEDEHPLPAYYIRLHSLTEALTAVGKNKSPQYDEVKKTCLQWIEALEKKKKELGDVKSQS